jgi:ferrous iron transport protein A
MVSSRGSTPNPTLNDVPVGQRVRIASLPNHAVLRERLLALGIRPGVVVQVVRRGRPGGILHLAHGPLEIMLRSEQAAEIQLMPDRRVDRPDDGGKRSSKA